MWYINVIFIKFMKFSTYAIVLITKISTGVSLMRHLIHEIWRDTYFDVIEERMAEVRKEHLEIRKMKIKDPNIVNTVGFCI